MRLLIILFLLIGLAGAVQPIDLSGFTKDQAQAFGKANTPLGLYSGWMLPDYGHWTSEYYQYNESMADYIGVPKSIMYFSTYEPPIPGSIG
jgi:hypothetical protein